MLVSNPNEFDLIRIGLASPERIRFWSHGEVQKPETINYRTFRPERKGLFCEKIFGPVKDWECACGKYRRVRYRGIVCERCGVEVTHSKVRRERMGHIELATPVAHIWFLKGVPSYIGLMLDLPYKTLEKVIYYDSYIITDVQEGASSELQPKQILSESEYLELKEKYGNQFKAEMGAKAIRDLLQQIELHTLIKSLRHEIKHSTGQSSQAYLKAVKRLRVAEGFLGSGNKPEWMINECIPVMPPDLRPMVQLEGGRFATSDLNDLYRRVVNRNNRLKRLLDIGAPNMIIRNEKRMLQEAVDVLIDNGRRGRPVTGSNGRPLRSLSDIIEGKQGRFRQNLLGKRVDYSGRSVIVVGPHLKLHQCGLPKEMAIELFKPFIIRKLVEKGHVQNVKSAKRKIEAKDVVVYDVLDEVIKGHPVFLNRAPTLHRLGVQAFEPVLVEGKAIQIHPLVCTAFNADFDGDQMAVHVPLSIEAQTESRLLMLSSNNLLSPSNGVPIITPTQDMVIGLYYLTITTEDKRPGDGKVFGNDNEALLAYDQGVVDLHAKIKIRKGNERIETTIGRLIFNTKVNQVVEHFRRPKMEYINKTISKKPLATIITEWHRTYGSTITAELCDKLKDLGYTYATQAGVSIAIDDLIVPKEKKGILEKAERDVDRIEELSATGTLSVREMKERAQEIWRTATADITAAMIKGFGTMNNVNMMATSGARGNIDQVRQLAGMRGLMADASGNTVDIPIKTNFREGLNMTEYFISSYGARKGIVDTALRTADSGYLTRRLVDVVQDVMITEEDCGTTDHVEITAIKDGYDTMVTLEERLTGKFAAEKVVDAASNEVLVDKGEEITYDIARKIQTAGIEMVKIRTALICRTRKGICQKCYGRDLSRDRAINIGEAVGIIAAQSIGEPGTQLTMRTFHTGGVDLSKATRVEIKASHEGKLEFDEALKPRKVKDDFGNDIVVATREGKIVVKRQKGNDITYVIPAGAELMAKNGSSVDAGDVIAGHNPSYEYIISGTEGTVQFIGLDVKATKNERVALRDGEIFIYNPKVKREYKVPAGKEVLVKEGVRVKAEDDLATDVVVETAGIVLKVDLTRSPEGNPGESTIVISPGEVYPILAGARLMIADGDTVDADDILAKESTAGVRRAARDIVAGLPRVEELFEARRPKHYALLTEIDGTAEVTEKEGVRTITISDGKMKKEYKVPYGTRLKVFPGKKVTKGDYLTDGIKDPHDVLKINGVKAAQVYLSEEIQKVYRSQGVRINEKHIETIIRQMTNKLRITRMGDSDFLIGDLVDVLSFEEANKELKAKDKEPAQGERVLLGITKASLNTESMFSAASFQETTSVLTAAAIKGKSDPMYGLKENVIIGKIIPAGTGLPIYRNIKLVSTEGEDLEAQIVPKEEVLVEEEA